MDRSYRGGFINAGLAVSLIIVLVAAGIAGFLWWQYITRLPERLLAEMPKKMADLSSVGYKIRIAVSVSSEMRNVTQHTPAGQPQEQRVTDILRPASMLNAFAGFFSKEHAAIGSALLEDRVAQVVAEPIACALPSCLDNVQIELRSSGVYEAKPGKNPNISSLFDASFKQNGETIGVSVEFRSIDDVYYFRLVELPVALFPPGAGFTPFGPLDPTKLLKNWYSLKAQTVAETKLFPNPKDINHAQRQEEIVKFKKLFSESHLFTIESSNSVTGADGSSVYHYVLRPDTAAIARFLKDAIRIQEDRQLTRTEEEQFVKFVDKLKNGMMEAWIDKNNGYLRKFSFTVPDLTFDAAKFNTQVLFEFSDFNTARVQIPTSVIPFDEDFKKLIDKSFFGSGGFSNGSSVNPSDSKRLTDITQIQLASALYFDANKSYPKELDLLAPTFLPEIPKDPVDGKPYSYAPHASNGSDAVRRGLFDGYHLGANLEGSESYNLEFDADCDSIKAINCRFPGGYEKNKAFNGGDETGCHAEAGRYCYDVEP